MREVVLHIGHGKTGTSAIQSYLALNMEELYKFDINYPAPLDSKRAKNLQVTSGNGTLIFDNYDGGHDAKATLFSSENLFFLLHGEQKFTEFILNKYTKVTVILYTRNVLDMLVSVWGQTVKRGGSTLSLNEYLTTQSDPHHEICLKWLNLSKQLNFDINIRNYSNHRHAIIDDFTNVVAKILNLENGCLAHLIKPSKTPINRSMTQAEYSVLQCLNACDPRFASKLSDAWVERLPDIKKEIPQLSKEAIINLKARYTDVLAELNDYLDESEKVIFEENDKFSCAVQPIASLSNDQINIFKELFTQRDFPSFDPDIYKELHPDVEAAGVDPYRHYLEFGIKEGRRILKTFISKK